MHGLGLWWHQITLFWELLVFLAAHFPPKWHNAVPLLHGTLPPRFLHHKPNGTPRPPARPAPAAHRLETRWTSRRFRRRPSAASALKNSWRAGRRRTSSRMCLFGLGKGRQRGWRMGGGRAREQRAEAQKGEESESGCRSPSAQRSATATHRPTPSPRAPPPQALRRRRPVLWAAQVTRHR